MANNTTLITGIEYEKLHKNKEDYIFVDTRSPREYAEATIPGAVNIPLFDDEENKNIGVLYKNEGKDASVLLGLEYVGKKLPMMYKSFLSLRKDYKKIAVFCARGGMRSSSIGSLLMSTGVSVIKVDKGFKGYRQFINNALPELVDKFTFIPLYGKTGSGKTYILKRLERLGAPVLDLEGNANHRGSLLGSIGLGACNTQKMFEALTFETLYKLSPDYNYVFTEGESKRIGRIIMPDYLYNKVIGGKKILIETDLAKRVKNIKDEYITDSTNNEEIKKAIFTMEPYIGKKRALNYAEAVGNNDYDNIIEELIINYYDNAYSKENKAYIKTFKNSGEEETAREILEYAKGLLTPNQTELY